VVKGCRRSYSPSNFQKFSTQQNAGRINCRNTQWFSLRFVYRLFSPMFLTVFEWPSHMAEFPFHPFSTVCENKKSPFSSTRKSAYRHSLQQLETLVKLSVGIHKFAKHSSHFSVFFYSTIWQFGSFTKKIGSAPHHHTSNIFLDSHPTARGASI
jgi:hypothetical protein